MGQTSQGIFGAAKPRNKAAIKSPQPFSHLQWYLSHARNTVYFAAQSRRPFSEEEFQTLVGLIMDWAPQLYTKADNAQARHVPVDIVPTAICKFEETDDLDKSLRETVAAHDAVFADSGLPNFRARCFVLRRPIEGKPQTLVVCRTSHALMEGSETSRLMRARQSVHNAEQEGVSLSVLQRGAITGAGFVMAPFHLMVSRFNRKDVSSGRAVVIDIDRRSVKKLALELGVRQRSVLFSLPLFGLHFAGELPRKLKKGAHLVSYSTLPDAKTTLEDSALNLRMQVGRFRTADTFAEHARLTDAVLERENTTEVYSQALYNSILGVHRHLQRAVPFLYGARFFTFVPYDFVLSLLPPHISGGLLRGIFDGPVYCGSYTPGVNSCVFVPNRTGFSLNMFVGPPVLDNVDAFTDFLDGIGLDARRIF